MNSGNFGDNIYWQLMDTLMAAKRKLAPILDGHGVTGVQVYILVSLSLQASGKPMSYLADQLHCDASNITSIVDKLELLGLIERHIDPADRRIKLLRLTAKGEQVCKQLIHDIDLLEKNSLSANRLSKSAAGKALSTLQKLT